MRRLLPTALAALGTAALILCLGTNPATAASDPESGPGGGSSRTAAQALQASGFYQFGNRASGRCLLSQNRGNNTLAVTYSCLPYNDQFWRLEYVGVDGVTGLGMYQVRNLESNRCLLSRNQGNGTDAVTYQCLPYRDQYWYVYQSSSDGLRIYYTFKNVASNRCLRSENTGNGSVAFQYACMGYDDQQWYYAGTDT